MADAAPVVPYRVVGVPGVLPTVKTFAILTLPDRRPSAPSPAPREWLLQMDLEDLLYPSVTALGTSGAFCARPAFD